MIVKLGFTAACNILGMLPTSTEPHCNLQYTWTPKSVKALLDAQQDGGTRADFTFTINNNRKTVGDATFTSVYNTTESNALKPKHAAMKSERDKIKKYNDDYGIPEGGFFPFAIESHGAWGPIAYDILFAQAERLKRPTENNMPSLHKHSWRYAKEVVSRAVCVANTEYLDNVRYASKKTSHTEGQERRKKKSEASTELESNTQSSAESGTTLQREELEEEREREVKI